MPFDAFEVALELIRYIRKLLEELERKDKDLANQLRRAAASVPLNLSEGRARVGRDRAHAYRIAAGSAGEVIAGLRVAEAWGYLELKEIEPTIGLANRVLAMTWRLTH